MSKIYFITKIVITNTSINIDRLELFSKFRFNYDTKTFFH